MSDAQIRRVLIVSPHFPPSTLAGVHRARHLANHLRSCGWVPTILCVDERDHNERLDEGLAKLVRPDVEIVKVRAFSKQASRLFGIGDIGLRSYGNLKGAIGQLLARQNYDAVLITGSPYYPMLLAPWINRRFGVPIVLDFQDPWVSDWGSSLPTFSKGRLAHRLALWLEPKALRAARFVTSVSQVQNEQMAARYPWLDASAMAALPIGGDPDDYARIAATDHSGRMNMLAQDAFNFTYVGTCLPRSLPLFELLFAAIKTAHDERRLSHKDTRFNFIGTSNQPNGHGQFQLAALADKYGLASLVHEVPERVPYLEALGVMKGSDALLLIGSDERHYTASKIYPALYAQKPFLSLFHSESSAHDILARSGGGIALSFRDEKELLTLGPAVLAGMAQLRRGEIDVAHRDGNVIAPFTAPAIAKGFAAIFDRIAGDRP